MKKITAKLMAVIWIGVLAAVGGSVSSAWAVIPTDSYFQTTTYSFTYYSWSALDWADEDDDNNSGSTALGFSVNLGGQAYTHFDINSNGYIELLTGPGDLVTNYGYGSIAGLTSDDPTSTYLLAAYDDLSSWYMGYYGYKLYSDRAVFYYDTETFNDGGSDFLNNFSITLYQSGGYAGSGSARWDFGYSGYSSYSYDLFSGVYYGNSGTLHELTQSYIPFAKSFEIAPLPEPASLLLLGSGLLSLIGFTRKKKGKT